jgi:AraC-like DNA-binding protein/NAD(P)-dependent dehydrogenase (short-subunit alcohol dehydrogenase family)
MTASTAEEVVAVTGAARGIGLAVARAFHAQGASVVLGDLDVGLAEEAAWLLGERAHVVHRDAGASGHPRFDLIAGRQQPGVAVGSIAERSVMPYRIPASFAAAAASMARERGVDLPALLIESGMSPLGTHVDDLRLSEDQAVRLAVAVRRRTDDELLGLGSPPVPRGTLRMLSYAMAGVSTLHEAIDRLSTLVRPLAGFPDIELEQRDGCWALRLDLPPDDSPDHVLSVISTAVADRIIGWAIGRTTPKVGVEFPFPEPPNGRDIARLLGADIRYDVPQSPALILPAGVLASGVALDVQSVLDYVARAPGEWLTNEPDPLPIDTRVRQLIERDLVRQHIATADEIAAALAISVPTLRRRLRTAGTSLRRIRDDVLADRARTALRTTDEPIGSIAARLGFSETSAFTRAFHRWTGEPPARDRAHNRVVVTAPNRPGGRSSTGGARGDAEVPRHR